jgi:cell division protein FtsZ
VVIDKKKLMHLAPQLPTKADLNLADQVSANMIKEIVETISSPGLVNPNFADLKTIVSKGGMAVVGVGESDAPNRAEEAVRNALRTPPLDVDYARANGALIRVAGDNHMTIEEVNRVGEIVTGMMDGNARVIWDANVNPSQEGKLRVTLVMTGVNSPPSQNGVGIFAPQLFNLETNVEPERQLDVKLNLYQMEP